MRRSLGAVLGVVMMAGAAQADPAPTGDRHVSYALSAVPDTQLTYRLYVPADWTPEAHWPLVVILHGFGGNADSPFREAGASLITEADRHHFILVAPAGYDGRGDYGANLALPVKAGPVSAKPGAMLRSPEQVRYAELDVMAVLDRVRQAYHTDPARTFLMGNSMGMTGTLHLAEKYPNRWCGISPSDGPPWPDYPVERLRYLAGAELVHGEADTVADLADTQKLAARMAAAGIPTRFIPVPGGTHPHAWTLVIPETFAFFDGLSCHP